MLFSPDGLSSPPLSKVEGQYGIGALGSTGGMSEGFPSCSQVLFQVILCCLSLVKTDCNLARQDCWPVDHVESFSQQC